MFSKKVAPGAASRVIQIERSFVWLGKISRLRAWNEPRLLPFSLFFVIIS
jgi:hypothetical protein